MSSSSASSSSSLSYSSGYGYGHEVGLKPLVLYVAAGKPIAAPRLGRFYGMSSLDALNIPAPTGDLIFVGKLFCCMLVYFVGPFNKLCWFI